MTTRPRVRTIPRLLAATGIAAILAGSLASPAAAATTAAWAQWAPFIGTSGDYSTAVVIGTSPALTAEVTSTSRSGQVGIISGASTWLSAATPVGAKYGSSRDQPYLNLRPLADAARIPSVTTYGFDSPTPASGWTFVLGDIDADMVQISARTATGAPATTAELGFRSGFNYCAPGLAGKPSCTGDALDVPVWDAVAATLTGNPAASDTSGAAAWFEPNVPLTSLTFSFSARSGFPIYQTWFASIARDIGGHVTTSDGLPVAGATVDLSDTNGDRAATATTDATGGYSFPGYTAAAGYAVELVAPVGQAVVGLNPIAVDITLADADDVDFTLREITGATATGRTVDSYQTPISGVTVTLVDQDGTSRTSRSDATGRYEFEALPGGSYTISAGTPAGYAADAGSAPFSIPENSETPVSGIDFVFAELSSISGIVTVGGDPTAGIAVEIDGPAGKDSGVTDADGRYWARDLRPGHYSVSTPVPAGAYAIGDPSVNIEIDEDGTEIDTADIAFAREGAATGIVQDPAGLPIAGAPVSATGPTGPASTRSNDNGVYTVEGLTAGSYEFTIAAPDGYVATTRTSQTITITTAGERVTLGAFELQNLDDVAPTTPIDPPVPPTTPIDPPVPPTTPIDPPAPPTTPIDPPAPAADPPASATTARTPTLAETGGQTSWTLIACSAAGILFGMLAFRLRRRH